MLDYALIELLETFSQDELKILKKFLISPYFNRSKKVTRLYDLLVKFHPNYDNPKLTKEYLHGKITPGKPYNELTMRSLLHDLQKLVSQFIQQKYLERKKAESKIFTIEELAIKGTERMHSITIKEAEKLLNSYSYVDGEQCLNRFKLETEKFYFNMIKDKISKKSFVDTEAGKLINGITYFISYFMLEAIKHNDVLLNYSRTYNVKHNYKFISQFLKLFDFERLEIFMESHNLAGIKIVKAYLSCLRAFLYIENDEYYYKMKSAILDNLDEFSITDKHILFSKLNSYCITKRKFIDPDEMKFEQELLDIYKVSLKNKFYETEANKYMPVDLYRNILIQAAKMNELIWMEEFIEQYGPLLLPKRREDIINYSYAVMEFERGNYNESLNWLSRIKAEEFSYHLDIKTLYIQNYYELGEIDSALSAVKAFSKFLEENSIITESKKESYAGFCKITTKLINLENTKSKTNISGLIINTQKHSTITQKRWLLKKLQMLDKHSYSKYSTAG